jgi:hypothetical protein
MGFKLNQAALDRILASNEVKIALEKEGKRVQSKARRLARPIVPQHVKATEAIIVTDPVLGPDGWESKLGYDKNHEGWFLWFHEVGTINHGPTPHLRPAVSNQE